MLHTGSLHMFEYRLKTALEDVEGGGTIFANVFSKSSNIGIDEAIDYLHSVVEEEKLESDKADEIIELLERSSRLR